MSKIENQKITHFLLKGTHFSENAPKYLILNEKWHLASKKWWEQLEGFMQISCIFIAFS